MSKWFCLPDCPHIVDSEKEGCIFCDRYEYDLAVDWKKRIIRHTRCAQGRLSMEEERMALVLPEVGDRVEFNPPALDGDPASWTGKVVDVFPPNVLQTEAQLLRYFDSERLKLLRRRWPGTQLVVLKDSSVAPYGYVFISGSEAQVKAGIIRVI